jgi:hypothetical protein
MDEQEKKWLLGTVLRFQREYPRRLVDVRHCCVGTGFHVTVFFFASDPTELVIFNAFVDERRLVGRLRGILKL